MVLRMAMLVVLMLQITVISGCTVLLMLSALCLSLLLLLLCQELQRLLLWYTAEHDAVYAICIFAEALPDDSMSWGAYGGHEGAAQRGQQFQVQHLRIGLLAQHMHCCGRT
jgi:hypothetical protein